MARTLAGALSLRDFLLRKQILDLYRSILRAIRSTDKSHHSGLLHYTRDKFEESFREVRKDDDPTIKYLMTTGRQWEERIRTAPEYRKKAPDGN